MQGLGVSARPTSQLNRIRAWVQKREFIVQGWRFRVIVAVCGLVGDIGYSCQVSGFEVEPELRSRCSTRRCCCNPPSFGSTVPKDPSPWICFEARCCGFPRDVPAKLLDSSD